MTYKESVIKENASASKLLAASGLAAVLSCTCCLGPLLLVTLGVTGTWLQHFAWLEPYRPFLLGFGLLAFVAAGFLIFRRQPDCTLDGWCANPRRNPVHRVCFVGIALVLGAAFAFPYVAKLFY